MQCMSIPGANTVVPKKIVGVDTSAEISWNSQRGSLLLCHSGNMGGWRKVRSFQTQYSSGLRRSIAV